MSIDSNKLIDVIKKYKRLLIYIPGSPDPDAIASSYALKQLCDLYGTESDIVASKELSLPQNIALVEKLHIPLMIRSIHEISTDYDAFAILDFQTAGVEGIREMGIPCAIHIDHHAPVQSDVKADYRVQREDIGSTSSIMALVLQELRPEFTDETATAISTALVYGIQTDTDIYTHATNADFRALNFITAYADTEMLKDISSTPMSKDTILLLWEAIENQFLYKDWLIASVGFVKESARDSIPIIADFFLKRQEAVTVVVFGAIESKKSQTLTVDASFRSVQENLNLNEIIKAITPEGGARKYKGAYQIPMDYLYYCPDKTLLWQTIKLTTIEILKHSRDRVIVTELKGFYKKFRRWFNRF